MDTEIFILLKIQAIGVFALLLDTREFANEKGLQTDVERLNISIAENKHMLSLANKQLAELKNTAQTQRLGFFDTVNNL